MDRSLYSKSRIDETCLGMHSESATLLVKEETWRQLLSTPPNDGDTQADDGDSNPTISADALTEEGFRS